MIGAAFERVRRALGDRVTGASDGHLDARCPSHEDGNRSLSVDARNGAVYLKCHAGCHGPDIARALGLSLQDLFDAPRTSGAGARIVAEYNYTDEAGAVLYQKVRREPKDFRIRYRVADGWVHKAAEVPGGVRWVLYNLPAVKRAIADAAPVYVVEGEKDADTLYRWGLVATTNAHGAAKGDQRPKWGLDHAAQLDGARDVIVIPDHDEAGAAHGRAIVQSLLALPVPPRVRVVQLPDLPEHGDVSDWIARGGTPEALAELVARTPDESPAHAAIGAPLSSDAEPRAAKPRLTLLRAADVAPERVSWLWQDWLPFGKLVNVDGVAGVGKSTLIMDLIARASRGGPMPHSEQTFSPVTVLVAGVEDGWGDTIRPRLDAADADLTRVHFVTPQPGEQFTIPRDVMELMARAAEVGATWLHIDAIMGAMDNDVNTYNDPETRRALGVLADAASDAGMLVTFIRHPRKSGGSAVNAGGGSVAFSALARVGLFVGWHPDDEGTTSEERRRVVSVSKSNIGKYPTSLSFVVINSPLCNDAGAISWRGPAAVTADELASPLPPLAADRGAARERPDPRAEERAWLRERLADGVRVKLDQLKADASAAGLQWHRIKRAATDEGVSTGREGFPSFGVWYLPTVQSVQLEQSEQSALREEMGAPTVPTVPTGEEMPVQFGEQADWCHEDAA